MAVTISSPPAIEPITLTELKLHLRVDGTDEDTLIESLLTVARAHCESFTRRQFITATLVLNLDKFPSDEVILLPYPPIQSPLTSVKYYDADGTQQTLTVTTDYVVDVASEPGRLMPAYGKSWPTTREIMNAVEITYKAGYGLKTADVPEGLKAAIKLLATHLYERREAVSEKSLNVVPLAIESLLWQYRVMELQ